MTQANDVEVLREALQPFATAWRVVRASARATGRDLSDDGVLHSGFAWRDTNGNARTLTWGDLRRTVEAMAALSRLLAVLEERAGGLPGGWVAVPREPTEEMWVAHWKALRLSPSEIRAWLKSSLRYPGPHESGCVTAYRAMLDAAPPVPVKERDDG